MQYQTFSKIIPTGYPVAILTPKLSEPEMVREYLEPGLLKAEDVIAYSLFTAGKKTPAVQQQEYLNDLLPVLEDLDVQYLLVTDTQYFQTLTGVSKSDAYLGYVMPNTFPATLKGRFNVIFCPNYRQVFYDPHKVRAKISQALDALYTHRQGTYRDPGVSIIKTAAYPLTPSDIGSWLQKLEAMDCDLTCDIEGFSLKHYSAGIGTISFAWSQNEGIAFPVDLSENPELIREMLFDFFLNFKHRMIYHNISYDASVLIYQLFMKNIIDTQGLLRGLDVMLHKWEDTKLLAYLATNSCAGNKLSLKDQAQEYAGNYAVENIRDIRKIPLHQLLEYNLVDALSTWYVYHKHWDEIDLADQREIYDELFKPAIVDIIQMQLTGMPLNMKEVKKAKKILEKDRNAALGKIQAHEHVERFTNLLKHEWVDYRNSVLKVKRVTFADANAEFNPNSAPQKQRLFYEVLGLPVIERTKTKQPSVKNDTLEKLKAYTEDLTIRELLDSFLRYGVVDKLYSTFIPPMEDAVLAPDGSYYLFGNFNLGGTVSGRLSSSDPNLQTIPSKKNKFVKETNYAKIIKNCFQAPKGWLMVGLDFSSLEDRISALTTKDPNKLKVYTDGYDGHCLRAYSYFYERMPDIDADSVSSINSIETLYPTERQDSKTPTFALTYQGTFITLIAKCGFTEKVARDIEARYHELYKVSDEWVAARLDEASKTGYITAAFGLRVRTPLLHQVIRGNSRTPHEAEAEGRTAGNALGQSWCLLNTRASVEFMRKVRASAFRLMIRPIAHIHDAQYYLIPDDIDVLLFLNEHLVKAVQWQEHPDIAHDQVKLGGNVTLFYPSWAYECSIANGATAVDIRKSVSDFVNKQEKKAA